MRNDILNRWRLAIKLIPLIVVVAALKLAFNECGWDDATLSPLYTGLVAGTIFLLGFLLAGTLADYKESEKMPGDLAASLETICDECLILHDARGPSPLANASPTCWASRSPSSPGFEPANPRTLCSTA